MDRISLFDIYEADWRWLGDALAAQGWDLRRGGGLDHSWAELSLGALQISMEYDRWAEGAMHYPAAQHSQILAALPRAFIEAYADCWVVK